MRVSWGFILLFSLISFLIIVPTVSLIASSFNSDPLKGLFGFQFTINHYLKVFDQLKPRILINTFVFAFSRTVGVLVLGTLLAWLIARTNIPAKKLLLVLGILPMLIPYMLLAIGMILLLGPRSGLLNVAFQTVFSTNQPLFNIFSMEGMILSSVVYAFPTTFLIVYPALQAMNPELEDAARVAGSGVFSALFRVTLPLLKPAILMAAVLSLIAGIEIATPALFIGTPARISVLSSEIYISMTGKIPPDYGLSAVFSIILAASGTIMVLIYRRLTGSQRKYETVTGKAPRPKLVSLGAFKWPIFAAIILFFCLFIIMPVILVLFEGLQSSTTPYDWSIFQRLKLENFATNLSGPKLLPILQNTAFIVLSSAACCLLISTFAGYFTIRTNHKGRNLLTAIAMLPMGIPSLAWALGMMWTYVGTPIYMTQWLLILALTTRYIPYGIALSSPSMYQLDKQLEEASRVIGASWRSTIRRVTLPLLYPSLFSALIWLVLQESTELELLLMLRGPNTEVLATWIWSNWAEGFLRTSSSVAILLMIVTLSSYALIRLIEGRLNPYKQRK